MSELGHIKPVQAWALVPVKSPIWAKTRLANLLNAAERARLQTAMLQDVLDQLLGAQWLTGVAIVCPDPGIQELAKLRGIRVYGDEPRDGGLNAAIAHGAERLRVSGAELVMILPADVPMLAAEDIDRAIVCAIQENSTVVVPDREMEGTNALVFWTDRPPRFQFGELSFQRHLQDRAQEPVRALSLASIARDIDWPDDLNAVRRRRGQGVAPNTNSALANCSHMITPVISEKIK